MTLDELSRQPGTGSAAVGPDGAATWQERVPGGRSSAIGPLAALAFAGLVVALDVGEFLSAVGGIELDLFNLLIGLPIPLTFVLAMACFHETTPPGRRLWTLLGIVFASMWATVSISVYFLQLTVVRFAAEQGRAADVQLISFGDLDRTSAA